MSATATALAAPLALLGVLVRDNEAPPMANLVDVSKVKILGETLRVGPDTLFPVLCARLQVEEVKLKRRDEDYSQLLKAVAETLGNEPLKEKALFPGTEQCAKMVEWLRKSPFDKDAVADLKQRLVARLSQPQKETGSNGKEAAGDEECVFGALEAAASARGVMQVLPAEEEKQALAAGDGNEKNKAAAAAAVTANDKELREKATAEEEKNKATAAAVAAAAVVAAATKDKEQKEKAAAEEEKNKAAAAAGNKEQKENVEAVGSGEQKKVTVAEEEEKEKSIAAAGGGKEKVAVVPHLLQGSSSKCRWKFWGLGWTELTPEFHVCDYIKDKEIRTTRGAVECT